VKQTVRHESIPIYTLEFDRQETSLSSVDAICGYFRARIDAHQSAVYIAEFDHFAHTNSLPDGQVGVDILAAKNLLYCLCIALPNAETLALRPRSIGIAETERGFLVTFMEAPLPVANTALEDWTKGLCDRRSGSATLNQLPQRIGTMRIAVTSQNFKTITGHAGKSRRFLVYEADGLAVPVEVERLDLPKALSIHEYHGEDHPLFQLGLAALVTQGAGQGFTQRMASHGIVVHATSESDPLRAVALVAAGLPLAVALPHEHDHGHDHDGSAGRGATLVQLKGS